MVALNFNAANVQPNLTLEPVPSDTYPVMITKSIEKPTKNGQGAYLELEMTIMQGHEFAGRKVYDRLNIKNANQTTVDIAYGTLSAICHVTGRLNMTNTEQLHGVPFMAVVVKVPRDDKPDQMTNNVRGYKDINGNDPGAAGNAAQPAGQPNWANNQAPQPAAQPTPAPAPAPAGAPAPAPAPAGAEAQPTWAQGGAPVTPAATQPATAQPAAQPNNSAPAATQPAANADTPPWLQNAS